MDPSLIGSMHARDSTEEIADRQAFKECLGSLLYLSNRTRPNITVATTFLSRFASNPSAAHWAALKRVLRYLASSTNLALFYPRGADDDADNPTLITFGDSDWACSADDRHSITGWVVLLGTAAIAWRSGRQIIITHSSTEAEITAASDVSREPAWFHQVYVNVIGNGAPTLLYLDNHGSFEIAAYSRRLSRRSKHMEIRQLYVRDAANRGII